MKKTILKKEVIVFLLVILLLTSFVYAKKVGVKPKPLDDLDCMSLIPIKPRVTVHLFSPTTDIEIGKNKFFNITLYVACIDAKCYKADCGDINISLFNSEGLMLIDPNSTNFYINETNPKTINLNETQHKLITFWINATGDYNSIHEFFAYANITSDLSRSSKTNKINVTIIPNQPTLYNSVQHPISPTTYRGQYNFNITAYDYDGDIDKVLFSWNNGLFEEVTTYKEIDPNTREYYFTKDTALIGVNIPFTWKVIDSQNSTTIFSENCSAVL
jgi:hypothetical protein